MGDINQIHYLEKFLPPINGPILEIGSKDYGNTSSLREIHPNNEYIGLDMEHGKNVDIVQDLTLGIGHLQSNYFELGICCSVLEHVRKPWIMAENITLLIRPEGYLYIAVPWVWRYHPYPDDYFRFSFRGIISLFPDFEWSNIYYSSTVEKEFYQIDDDNLGVDNSLAAFADTPLGQRKYLPYLQIHMLGKKLK